MTRLHTLSSIVGAALLAVSSAAAGSSTYTFQTLNNSGDPNFNQLLGVNNSKTIVGYFGDGTVQPNQGYTLSSPYTSSLYTNENFPGSAQTQVVGINNSTTPTTVGFWVDANGNNFGFVKQGSTFTSIQNPNTPTSGTVVNQLLGVNDANVAAGFYTNAGGNNGGYLYNIGSKSFTAITDPLGVSTIATDINNSNVVSGFYTDAGGNTHGFLDVSGTYHSYDDPNGTNTMFFGLNNKGQVVGSYVDGSGVTDGLIYNFMSNTWQTVNDPNASATAAFGVTGTTINGINDYGQIVGFYSDGTNVDGFTASTPEPTSLALMSAGLLAAGLLRKRKRS